MKKIFTREVKVGILAVVVIFVLYFGLNFLKGIDIFSSTEYYYGAYDDLNGLTKSAPVYVKGYKVGQIEEITYDFAHSPVFTVRFSVDQDIKLPVGTEANLIADGLLGGTALQLNFPAITDGQTIAPKDTLPTNKIPGLIDELTNGLVAQISGTLQHVDSLLGTVQNQLEGDHLKNSLASIDHISAELAISSTQLKRMLNNDMPVLVDDAKTLLADFKTVGGNLKQIDFAATMASVDNTISKLNTISTKLDSEEGSLGLLMNDKQLYLNLSNTAASADKLLIDLQEHPKRYVHFSLFGGKKTE